MKKNIKALILSFIATLAIGSFAACNKKPDDSSSDVVSESVGNESVGGGENSESQEENDSVVIEEEISILLTETETIARFATKQLTPTVKGTQKAVSWSSSNPAVATVENGLVTALTIGETVITASIGEVSASCVVTVTETNVPHEIEVSMEEIIVFEGAESEAIDVSVRYNGEAVEGDFEYTWTLVEGDEGVATIASLGEKGQSAVFQGVKAGKVTYAIYTEARGYKTVKNITVTVRENSYTLGIAHKEILPVANGYAVGLTLGSEETDNVTFGDAYLAVNGIESEEKISVAWNLVGDNVTFVDGKITALKAGVATLTGTATYQEEQLSILLTVSVEKGREAIDVHSVIETATMETYTIPDEVEKGEVEKIYIGNAVFFDKANAKCSLSGKVATIDVAQLPAKMADLGDDKEMTIETDLMIYTMTADVYTMVIDSAEELDKWQETAAENAVKAGTCIEAQKGLAYDGYFVLGGDIEYNKEWASYKKYGDLWGLCYNNKGIWKDPNKYVNGQAPGDNDRVEGAIVEDWGAGASGGFQGIFDGKGYAIEGLNVQGQYNGFITTMGLNGVVRNIAFTQTKIGEQAGLIERGGRGGLVENVYVEVKEMASNAKLITMHGWTKMTNVIVNVTDCSFYGIENSYFLNLAYVDAQNAYVIDRDYLEDSKMDFKTSTAPSAFLHLHPTKDLGGSFATVEALLADETHGKNVRGFGGYWKVEDGKLYFGDVRVATAAERVTDETEYKTDEENKVVFENEAFTAGSEWTLYIGDVASSVTVTEAGKVEVEIDPATINGYRTVVKLQSEEMILSYVNVIAVTYIHNAAELRALGVGTSAISSVEGNDKKGYYMLADDIDCAEENAFAAGYSYQKSYFKGVFDGNSKTISNITVNEGGIFGGMSGAVVKNVNFTGVKYNAKLGNYAGNWSNYTALLGQLANNGTVIENINVQVAATDFQYGVDNMKEALLFAYAWGGVVVRNVTVDASYLDLENVLGENITPENTIFENYVIKAASYAMIGYGADSAGKPLLVEWPEGVEFQTVAKLGITNKETTVMLGTSLKITTVASSDVTISLKAPVDGVTLEGDVVSVAETATVGATFTVVVSTADGESVEKTFTIFRQYATPEHLVTDTNGVALSQYSGMETAFGFEQGTYVFEVPATTDVWNGRVIIEADSSYDYVQFNLYLTKDVEYLTGWPAKDKATKGSLMLNGGGMTTSDGAIRTVQVFDANGNTMAQQHTSGFKANTLYTVRVCFNKGEELNQFHISTSTDQKIYIANVTWSNFTVRNDVYLCASGALLAKYDGDVTAIGFDAGSVVTKAEITDGWASRVRVDGCVKYDYVDVEFALGDNRAVSSLCLWGYKPGATILSGNYTVTATEATAQSGAAERKIQILDADGNAITELKANTVYTLRIYLNGGTDSAANMIAISTFNASADSPAIMYFGDITYGNDAN